MTEENNKIKIGKPAGFRDFYPEEYAKVNFVLDTMRKVSQEFGYVEFLSPAVELLNLYELKSGEGLISETFKVNSRSGQKLVLIPELTPSLTRMLAEKQQYYTKPIRWFSIPKCYRDETLQRGRVKEFWQYNADILGEENIYADAEIITILARVISECGLTEKQFVILVNDRNFMQQFFEKLNITDFLPLIRLLDRKDKIIQERIEKELKGAFSKDEIKDISLKLRHATAIEDSIFNEIPKTQVTERIIENFSAIRKSALTDAMKKLGLAKEQISVLYELSEIKDTPAIFIKKVKEIYPGDNVEEALQKLSELAILLKSFGVDKYIIYDGSLARGLDYYTGIVFEAWSREGLIPRAIAGGGRYADLVETLGGQPLTGTGFGFGETVLMEIMSDYSIPYPEQKACDVYFAPIKLDDLTPVIKLLTKFQENGIKTIFNPFDWKIKRHFENAERQNVEWMIIVGNKDLAEDAVTLRNIITGQQEQISMKKIVSEIKKRLIK